MESKDTTEEFWDDEYIDEEEFQQFEENFNQALKFNLDRQYEYDIVNDIYDNLVDLSLGSIMPIFDILSFDELFKFLCGYEWNPENNLKIYDEVQNKLKESK
jgi:hypothetical protein